jgi:Zn-dependent protease
MIKILMLLLGGAKLGKLLTTGGTMLISLVVYAFVYGWRYAAGFIALLFLHEMGHYIAARQRGLDVGLPTFIPFVGAWINLKQLPHNAETEAYVGLGGPVLGSIGALACFLVAEGAGPELKWLMAVAYAGFFLNLFNLIPMSPLDGGRITAVLSPKIWLLGIPVLVGLAYLHPSPMLILVALLAAPQLMQAWRDFRGQTPLGARLYYQTSLQDKLIYGFAYLGLLAFLATMTHEVHELMRGPAGG